MKQKFFLFLKVSLLSLIVCFPVIFPYFKTGYFPTHDGEWAVVRLSDMYREVKSFEIPARYSTYLNFQYGYPLFNFTYPMPYYFGVAFVFLKFGFVGSIKILFAASVLLSYISMFYLSKSVWKSNWAGFLSGIFYIYVPYRIVDLYVRGSIGESLSFVLFPIITLFLKRIYENNNSKTDILFFGIFYALLITTHNIMSVLFGFIILFVIIAGLFKKKLILVYRLILGLIYSLCLSAFFWIPAILEKNLIRLSQIPIADRNLYFAKPLDLILPKWGYATPTDPNGFGYQIGVAHLVVLVTALILIIKYSKGKKMSNVLFLIICTFFSILMMFSFSSVIWSNVPLLSEINYPWTILAVIAFTISLLAGFLTSFPKVKYFALFLAAVAIVFLIPHAKPSMVVNRGDDFYATNQATTTSSNELMPLWVKKEPISQPSEKVKNLTGNEKINVTDITSNKISFNTYLSDKRLVQVNLIYFPGWNLYVNGILEKINYNNDQGVMRVELNKGQNSVLLKFQDTGLTLFSEMLSVLSLIFFFVIIILDKMRVTKK